MAGLDMVSEGAYLATLQAGPLSPSDALALDEAMARALQAQDNGLRKRRRSTATTVTTVTPTAVVSSSSSEGSELHRRSSPLKSRLHHHQQQQQQRSKPRRRTKPARSTPLPLNDDDDDDDDDDTNGSDVDSEGHDAVRQRREEDRQRHNQRLGHQQNLAEDDDEDDKHSSSGRRRRHKRRRGDGADLFHDDALSMLRASKTYCQGCGKPLSDEVPGGVAASETNMLSCSSCVTLYGIPPCDAFVSDPVGEQFEACPHFRCTSEGCSLSFLVEQALLDHCDRVHS